MAWPVTAPAWAPGSVGCLAPCVTASARASPFTQTNDSAQEQNFPLTVFAILRLKCMCMSEMCEIFKWYQFKYDTQ